MPAHGEVRPQPPGHRSAVLRDLQDAAAPLSTVRIAVQLGLHPNTGRLHLDTLAENGRVEHVPSARGGPGGPSRRFRAVRRMDPTGPQHSWSTVDDDTDGASGEEPIERLATLLDGLGFAPEHRDANGQVRLGVRHRRLLELAEAHGQVVCPVHLGSMQGAMEPWGAPATVERLEAVVESDLCRARITPGATP